MTATLTSPLQIKADDDVARTGRITGYASVFDHVDLQGDRVERGAFREFLESTSPDRPTWPKLLWSHNSREPIGMWRSMREDSTGLRVEGEILRDVQRGREALVLLQAGAIQGLSIGFHLDKWRMETGRERVRVLEAITLKEVSVVAFPAETHARVITVKGDFKLDEKLERAARDFASWCVDDLALRPPFVVKFERRFGALGTYRTGQPGQITVDPSLPRDMMLGTIAHELKHAADHLADQFGLRHRSPSELSTLEKKSLEDRADAYERDALHRYAKARAVDLSGLVASIRATTRSIRGKEFPTARATRRVTRSPLRKQQTPAPTSNDVLRPKEQDWSAIWHVRQQEGLRRRFLGI